MHNSLLLDIYIFLLFYEIIAEYYIAHAMYLKGD